MANKQKIHSVTIPLIKTENIGIFDNRILLKFNSKKNQVYWDNIEAFASFQMLE